MNGILPSHQHGPPPHLVAGDNVLGDMSQWLGGAPVFPEPGERHRVVRAKSEYLVRHRDERVQIERTRLARSHTCDSAFVATANSFAQLSGQHARPGHAQRARLSGRRRQQVKDILFHTVEVELPWDDTRARGGTPKGGELLGHPNDGEVVVQPIGVRQPHGCGPASGQLRRAV